MAPVMSRMRNTAFFLIPLEITRLSIGHLPNREPGVHYSVYNRPTAYPMYHTSD